MPEKSKKNYLLLLTIVLLFITAFVFYFDFKSEKRDFTFAMLDVGQGDSLFIESPTGTQVLVDGGPPKKILSQLARVMSHFDRSIDMIIITNPDLDHIGGFLDVLDVYKVGVVVHSGTYNDSTTYEKLKMRIKEEGAKELVARRGMIFDLGEATKIEVLFPDRDVSEWLPNDGSIVAKLSYRDFSVMLTGDATLETEKIILKNETADTLDSDILKVGHHGSHTSTSYNFLKAVSPEYALISVGENNRYGHPHEEVLYDLDTLGVRVFRTDLLGNIIFTCDKIEGCMINK